MNVKNEKQFRFFIFPLNWAAWSSDPDLRSGGSAQGLKTTSHWLELFDGGANCELV